MEFLLIFLGILSIAFFYLYKNKKIILSAKGKDIKVILVVRNDLNMGKGKIAAQCCHACLGLYKRQIIRDKSSIDLWEKEYGKKIVVRCNDEKEMFQIAEAAERKGLGTYIVCDAGFTQVAPNSNTVLAIGPASSEQFKDITGHLKLL
ncbi:unnamed protein product [Blepharisma stoltei]|uniref:peptidyl-tRNA hydrolase n=1 Tax=Blepharisma stoltei TaxID=1481888 RepID=A0AAU9JNV7_9CILI|nr:unnamed protein product [Blepharisma stoltei]